jgi:hypothetical protein
MKYDKKNVIDKTIFVSIIYLDKNHQFKEQIQNCGKIIKATSKTIEYQLIDSEQSFTIPAYYDNIDEANPELVYLLDQKDMKPLKIDLVTTFTVIPKE